MRISSHYFIQADRFCDWIPVLSLFSNIANVFMKCVVIPIKERRSGPILEHNYYYAYLKQKSVKECLLLTLPGLNIVLKVYDLRRKKREGTPTVSPTLISSTSSTAGAEIPQKRRITSIHTHSFPQKKNFSITRNLLSPSIKEGTELKKLGERRKKAIPDKKIDTAKQEIDTTNSLLSNRESSTRRLREDEQEWERLYVKLSNPQMSLFKLSVKELLLTVSRAPPLLEEGDRLGKEAAGMLLHLAKELKCPLLDSDAQVDANSVDTPYVEQIAQSLFPILNTRGELHESILQVALNCGNANLCEILWGSPYHSASQFNDFFSSLLRDIPFSTPNNRKWETVLQIMDRGKCAGYPLSAEVVNRTFCQAASSCNDPLLLQRLFNEGANVNYAHVNDWATPLYYAVRECNKDAVSFLLEKRADHTTLNLVDIVTNWWPNLHVKEHIKRDRVHCIPPNYAGIIDLLAPSQEAKEDLYQRVKGWR